MRPLRRLFGAPPRVPPALRRANAWMAAGEYLAAAEAFERLARGAETRRLPRAPHLYLRAGQARILAGETAQGMEHIRYGLEMLAARGQWPALHRIGRRVVRELNERGLNAEAQQIETYLEETLPEMPAGTPMSAARRKVTLPTHCPACGGPLRPDEVEWLDDVTAECAYCGSPVRGE
ncbi:MAG: hypothetical protein D6770_08745 [Anaerolineae bacterium]|nr:MAG: hypothetical protein D6770_08745 [Anaerolineae bacterium]